MRKLVLNRHESEVADAVYRDADKRYCVFESDGRWVMCRTDRSGAPIKMLGVVPTLSDARLHLRIDRGPFSRADWWTIIVGVAVGAVVAWMFTAGIIGLKALIIGVAVAVVGLMVVTAILGLILCHIIAKAFRGMSIF